MPSEIIFIVIFMLGSASVVALILALKLRYNPAIAIAIVVGFISICLWYAAADTAVRSNGWDIEHNKLYEIKTRQNNNIVVQYIDTDYGERDLAQKLGGFVSGEGKVRYIRVSRTFKLGIGILPPAREIYTFEKKTES